MLLLSLLLILHASVATPKFLHSLPEDTHAFPKFHVVFLNGHPVLNDTAHRWLTHGLRGGQSEFLDQPWTDRPSKEIDSGTPHDGISTSHHPSANYSLELMKMGPTTSYLCLIPKPADMAPVPTDEEDTDELAPSRSWSLLQPLSGTCLYHRQGWFTYSYCHNDEIRQFKEANQVRSHPPGAYKPEEDPEWEAYTLGKAPKPGADLTVAEQNAHAVNLELARTAGSRYLVQRWGDGTLCDKTGKNREVEVQFHCSMTVTDTILFVKEAKTCSYVVVIHTPRLCGEPGFKSRRDAGEENSIRCREIVDKQPEIPTNLPAADLPNQPPRSKPIPAPPVKARDDRKDKEYNNMLRKALDTIMEHKEGKRQKKGDAGDAVDENEMVIEILGEEFMTEAQVEAVGKVTEALRAVGYEVKTDKTTTENKESKKESSKKQPAKKYPRHEEL